jgi:hypothetical protein
MGTWVLYQRLLPRLFPPTSKMAARFGSKANRIRHGSPAIWTRSSFMFEYSEPLTVSTWGRPSCGPRSRSNPAWARISARSLSPRPSSHWANSASSSISQFHRHHHSMEGLYSIGGIESSISGESRPPDCLLVQFFGYDKRSPVGTRGDEPRGTRRPGKANGRDANEDRSKTVSERHFRLDLAAWFTISPTPRSEPWKAESRKHAGRSWNSNHFSTFGCYCHGPATSTGPHRWKPALEPSKRQDEASASTSSSQE